MAATKDKAGFINNMQFHCEDGLELLSRFSEKRCSINLDKVLFPTGIGNRNVIEIVGASSTGKTLLLCQFIAKCILPAQYKEINIDGYDACAILIDTFGHIQMSKIAELMISMIRNAQQTASVKLSVETLNSVVSKSLENLTVFSCCNNDQLQQTLYTLENEFLGNKRIALVAIDSILAYYWQERKEKGILSMDQYIKNLVSIIRAQTSQFSIVTIYTRCDRPMSEYETHVKRTNILQVTGVNYKLQLCKSTIVCEFIIYIHSKNDIKQIHYTISDSGIKWNL